MSVEGMTAAGVRRMGDLAVNVDFVVAAFLWNGRVDGGSWGFELFEGMVAVLSCGLVVERDELLAPLENDKTNAKIDGEVEEDYDPDWSLWKGVSWHAAWQQNGRSSAVSQVAETGPLTCPSTPRKGCLW